ncbi:hypothetical protein Salat_1672900 [Sesamum alatum]|uniref:Uncharacterized protein n=1 Tax=Sesamum alatum TaxID=300844 RepID=A0AAE1Y6V8_9LAMI|nr:hypothetical protein Salat_1672900 [Sesamum alatum]
MDRDQPTQQLREPSVLNSQDPINNHIGGINQTKDLAPSEQKRPAGEGSQVQLQETVWRGDVSPRGEGDARPRVASVPSSLASDYSQTAEVDRISLISVPIKFASGLRGCRGGRGKGQRGGRGSRRGEA